MTKPDKLTIRTYQVGFGDCFLLTFHYPKSGTKKEANKHVLIDFGSTGAPAGSPPNLMRLIAEDIATTTGGKLTAVVATHRHKDHISGFATAAKAKGPGDVIRKLKPDVVMQPWTEDPRAKKDAEEATKALASNKPLTGAKKLAGNVSFVGALSAMQSFSDTSLREMKGLRLGPRSRLRKELAFIGDDNLANLAAVENLMTMGGKKGKQEYLAFGDSTKLQKLLPGVKVLVIGPPTIKQSDTIKKQRSKDPDEFWHLMGLSSHSFQGGSASPFGDRHANNGAMPPWARWLVPKMLRNRASGLLELVRILDDAMNNTSLILLFEVGGKRFLFPGDAQIENWNYVLKGTTKKHEAIRKMLEKVDFYKVGHHGSLNATPKTLWGLFTKKGKAGAAGRLKTVVSTMPGKHGSTTAGTEVPRRPLVEALSKNSDYFSTTQLERGKKKADKMKVLSKDFVTAV
ncbi:hypothetical protein [Prosthecobacter sp.]|uniref:hypothetical protein n=1 Tax=Prosthecobacter sp. TaxID=1965333 RepID=UPI002ABBF163|nr:hypothetical protein [Prosthecobacter sp.]MDZ4406268.1 hypothetical protein [Prosthecobacter sp.]